MFVAAAASVGCSRKSSSPDDGARSPTRSEIFAAIESRAAKYRIDPAFVYALVAAESNFDPRARKGEACGLLQLKPAAWRTVATEPFEPAVWDWRANLNAGIDYLAYSRAYLHRRNVFSYPLLLAAFHYGLDHVEERGFDLQRLPVPDNEIYRQLWAGNLSPVTLPNEKADNKKPAAKAAGD
jgi:soluble lytic murein transglycosylase-like protein